MKRTFLLAVAALSFLAFAAPAHKAEAAVSVGVSVGGRHSGFSLSFQSRPEVVLIPSSRVYYAENIDQEDLYCYGDNWYYVDDGAWFYSSSYRGPFVEIAFASVPFQVRNVPVSYRRHWGRSNSYTNNSYGTSRDRSWTDRSQTSTRDRNWGDRNQSPNRDRSYNDRNQGRGRGDGNQGRGNGWGRGGNRNRGR